MWAQSSSNTARKRWTKEENKTAISCYLNAMEEIKQGHRKRMYNLWNDMGMFEIEGQHLACQVRSIFKNNRLDGIEIQQLQKEIEKDEIVPDRVDTLLEIGCGGLRGTETVREQCCDLEDYQHLIEIMHEGTKGDVLTLRSIDITLMAKHMNQVYEVVKCIPISNLSDVKNVARASALLVCEKTVVKIDHILNKKGTILELENRKRCCNFEKEFK